MEIREICPGLYTDGHLTWRRNNVGQTTHPDTKERVHYEKCGHSIIRFCGCIGHEGELVDTDGGEVCPSCWDQHRADVPHSEKFFSALTKKHLPDPAYRCPECGDQLRHPDEE